MKTFLEWLADASPGTKDRLETAVREYLAKNPEMKKCYYVTRPKNMHFDPGNPKHVEDELGPDYDRSLDVVPFKHHPMSFTCVNAAEGLAKFLREKGFKARKVAGWYGSPEAGYNAGYSPSMDSAWPPQNHGMKSPQQHWWVEAEGHYIDITSAQFHPTSPDEQKELVIRDKHDAFVSRDYLPVRRFPLGRAVPLPPNIQRMVDKITSLKKFAQSHSSNPNESHELSEWIERNAKKYGLSESRLHDVIAALKAHTNPGFHFSDKRAMERLFGEAFDDIEESEDLKKQDLTSAEYKPAHKPESRGTIKRRYDGRISLSTVIKDQIKDNFDKMKEIIGASFSDEYEDTTNNYGTVVYKISAKMDPFEISDETRKKLRDAGFKTDF